MKQSSLRTAFEDWCSRHPYVDRVALYRAVLRSRNIPLRELQTADVAQLERDLHILLFGFGMCVAGAVAATLLSRAKQGGGAV